MWAIVPIKTFESAKQRLASVLSPDERRSLMLAMARDVLTALARCQRLTGILIVSRTHEADALAHWASTIGLRAKPLHLVGYGDEEEATNDEAAA